VTNAIREQTRAQIRHRILAAVDATPRTTAQISAICGENLSSVAHTLGNAARAGIVAIAGERSSNGRSVTLWATSVPATPTMAAQIDLTRLWRPMR